MGIVIGKYKRYFTDKNFLISCLFSFALLVVSFIINSYAGIYATEKASNSVTDLILSNTPVFDLDGIFIYGSILLWIVVTLICLWDPKKIPFTVKSIALFILIRSVFITLTHIGPFPNQIIIDPLSIISYFSFGGDLFFSGHTGLPFLMALLFWDDIWLRIIFLIAAVIFGMVVLMAHLHYTIDVLSAFFITYSIFHIAIFLFKKDFALLRSGI